MIYDLRSYIYPYLICIRLSHISILICDRQLCFTRTCCHYTITINLNNILITGIPASFCSITEHKIKFLTLRTIGSIRTKFKLCFRISVIIHDDCFTLIGIKDLVHLYTGRFYEILVHGEHYVYCKCKCFRNICSIYILSNGKRQTDRTILNCLSVKCTVDSGSRHFSTIISRSSTNL